MVELGLSHMVFLCHSFNNYKIVDALEAQLTRDGVECWRAPSLIPWGEHWCSKLAIVVGNADAVILILTKEANESDHVERELHIAMEAKRTVIPVIIGRFQVSSAIRYYIAGLQAIHLPARGKDSTAQKIAAAVSLAFRARSGNRNNSRPPTKQSKQTRATPIGRASSIFNVNYMRLFGAIEVPFLMELIGTEPEFCALSENDEEEPYYYRVNGGGRTHIAQSKLVRFWKHRWRYRRARPLLSPLWMDIAGSKEEGKRLYWRALNGERSDIVGYASHQDIDEDGENWSRVAASQGLLVTHHQMTSLKFTKSTDVGFLFAIFEYQGSQSLSEVALELGHFPNPLVRHTRFLSPTPHTRRRVAIKAETIALKAHQITAKHKSDPTVLQISNIAPGDCFIMLLQVYRSNKDRLPEFYLTDAYVPKVWTWEDSAGQSFSQPIRKPFGRSAARIEVPSGWFGQ